MAAAALAGARARGSALEHAGAHVWTEVVLKHARLHPPAQVRTPPWLGNGNARPGCTLSAHTRCGDMENALVNRLLISLQALQTL